MSDLHRQLLLNGRRIRDEALISHTLRVCRQAHTKRRKGPEPIFVLNIACPRERFLVR